MEHVYKYGCSTEEETVNLSRSLAKIAKKGDVFLLNGTLGMGKSVFARAFIKELTNAKEVPSPTFTLVQAYSGKNVEIYHFDLYRIKNPEEIFEIGIEEAMSGGISLIEWPNLMGCYKPRGAFEVSIKPNSKDENARNIEIKTFSTEKNKRLEKLKV